MSTALLAVLVGVPLAWLVALAAFAYYDAGRVGMDPVKWGAVVLLVPLFGFFAYLFERSERVGDGADTHDGPGYSFHESRTDDPRDE